MCPYRADLSLTASFVSYLIYLRKEEEKDNTSLANLHLECLHVFSTTINIL